MGNPLPEPGALRRMVLVTWRDSCIIDDYENGKDAWPYTLLWTMGFVLRDDAEGVVIAMETEDRETAERGRHVASIPRENIISVKELIAEEESRVKET